MLHRELYLLLKNFLSIIKFEKNVQVIGCVWQHTNLKGYTQCPKLEVCLTVLLPIPVSLTRNGQQTETTAVPATCMKHLLTITANPEA